MARLFAIVGALLIGALAVIRPRPRPVECVWSTVRLGDETWVHARVGRVVWMSRFDLVSFSLDYWPPRLAAQREEVEGRLIAAAARSLGHAA